MENILGDESYILDLFEKNPFEPYLEIRIHLDQIDSVLLRIKNLKGIDYVRDNREVLEQIKGITSALEILGYLVIAAVSITTLVIISHMIRQVFITTVSKLKHCVFWARRQLYRFPVCACRVFINLRRRIAGRGFDYHTY